MTSILDDMRALLGPEADDPSLAKKKHNLSISAFTELSLVDVGANPHADIVLMKRDSSSTELVKLDGMRYHPELGPPDPNMVADYGAPRRKLKADESAFSRAKPSKPNYTPVHDPDELSRKSPDDPAATIASLRDLLEQMTTLLKPETPISDRVIDADIKDPSRADQRRSNAYQSEGQSQADAQQAAREAQDEASRELAASIATRNNADILNAMMRIAGALNPNGVKSG